MPNTHHVCASMRARGSTDLRLTCVGCAHAAATLQVYDTTAAAGGALGVKAVRLGDSFVQAYREGEACGGRRCCCGVEGGPGGLSRMPWPPPPPPPLLPAPHATAAPPPPWHGRLPHNREDPRQGAVLARRVCGDPCDGAQLAHGGGAGGRDRATLGHHRARLRAVRRSSSEGGGVGRAQAALLSGGSACVGRRLVEASLRPRTCPPPPAPDVDQQAGAGRGAAAGEEPGVPERLPGRRHGRAGGWVGEGGGSAACRRCRTGAAMVSRLAPPPPLALLLPSLRCLL